MYYPKNLTVLYCILSTIVISSCRYGKPLFAAIKENNLKQDTAKGETTITKRWSFLCMRTGINVGVYKLTKTYNSHHILIYKNKFKDSMRGGEQGCEDCPDRIYIKTVFYNSHGEKIKIKYGVTKGGYHLTSLVNKTKVFEKRDTL